MDPFQLNSSVTGRFLTVAVNVGVTSCRLSDALPVLGLYLDDAGTETHVGTAGTAGLCPSDDPTPAYAGERIGMNAALFTGAEVGVVIRNVGGQSDGNDHAFDDVRILDVTPQLDKEFTDEDSSATDPLEPGTPTDLVLTSPTPPSWVRRPAGASSTTCRTA